MGNKVVVIGSSNTDMILKLAWIPKPGETILGGDFSMAAGGKGANQAVAAARAGADVHLVAKLGRDVFGEKAIKGFQQNNINTDLISFDETTSSGTALIFVSDDAENSIGVSPGANGLLSKDDVAAATDSIASADIVLLQLEIPIETVEEAVSIAAEKGVRVILNPAPARELSDELLSHVSVLTPNETEAELLTGINVETEEDCLKAAEILHGKGVETVVITLGSKGAFVDSPDFAGMVEGFKADAVDTTAAGDVFNAALTVALANGKPLTEAVSFGNAAASIAVTQLGAQPSAPQLAEITKKLEALDKQGTIND